MTTTLSFSSATHPIQIPAIDNGYTNGLKLQIWVRRSGTDTRLRIFELGNGAGTRAVLETGDQPDSLTLGVEHNGGGRQEITALGVIPLNRWVQVTALISQSGASNLFIFGTQVASGNIGTTLSGNPVNCRIGGGNYGKSFVGELSQLDVWVMDPTAGQTVWASYPLDQVTYDHTAQVNHAPVQYYRAHDASANNRDGTVVGSLPTVDYPAPLIGGPVPVIQFDGTGAPLRISPISGISGKLTLEAWVRPVSTSTQQAVILLNSTHGQLGLCIGGSQQEISVVLVTPQGNFTLCTAPNMMTPGVWSHIAATVQRDDPSRPTLVSIYRQGQFITSQATDSVLNAAGFPSSPFIGLSNPDGLHESQGIDAVLRSPIIPKCYIGGQATSISMLSGRLSEVRIWTDALDAATIAARFLSRAIGNEASLAACYRLEQIVSGCTFDMSAQRGFGSMPATGSSLYSAIALPLLGTMNSAGIYINVRGKLVTETILTPGITFSLLSQGGSQPITTPPQAQQMTVFDATLEPQSPDGSSLGGSNLSVVADGNVTAFIDKGDLQVPNLWSAGQVYSLPLPLSGKIRLRFVATDLSFPTLRVRIDGMPDGLWTIVRPDREALSMLAGVSQQDLLSPASGKPSPLPANSSADDAATYVTTLQALGSAFGPPAALPPTVTDRSVWTSISGTAQHLANDIDGGVQTVVSDAKGAAKLVIDGTERTFQEVGSAAGTLAHALVDDGQTSLQSLLQSATRNTKSAFSLVSQDFMGLTNLSDLIVAAAQCVPRYGQSAIETAVGAADRLAIVANAAAGEIAHTFSIIGTSIVNGVTVAWRVVCAGVKDALSATVSFLKRLGADIMQFLKYLAWLFKWHDFLAASDEAYAAVQTGIFPEIASLLDGLNKYKDQIAQLLTIPQGIGDKSIAQLTGINLNPASKAIEELNYIFELGQKVLGSENLAFDGIEQVTTSLVNNLGGIDLSSFSSSSDSFVNTAPNDTLSSPTGLITTPIQSLLNSALTGSSSTSFVDFFFNNLVGGAKTALSVAQSLLVLRINIPGLTSMIEDTILEGRSLNILRLVSLCAAIPKVLEQKIIASTQSNSTQAASFADDGPLGTWGRWLKVGFGGLSSILATIEMIYDTTVGAKAANGSTAQKKAFHLGLSYLELAQGLTDVCVGIVDFADDMNLNPTLRAAKDAYSSMHVISGGCLAFFASGLIYDAMSPPDTGMITLASILKAFHLVSATLTTCGSIIFSIVIAATPGAFSSDTDKAAFGLKVGAHVVHLSTVLINSVLLVSQKSGTLGKAVPVLSFVMFLLELSAAITTDIAATT